MKDPIKNEKNYLVKVRVYLVIGLLVITTPSVNAFYFFQIHLTPGNKWMYVVVDEWNQQVVDTLYYWIPGRKEMVGNFEYQVLYEYSFKTKKTETFRLRQVDDTSFATPYGDLSNDEYVYFKKGAQKGREWFNRHEDRVYVWNVYANIGGDDTIRAITYDFPFVAWSSYWSDKIGPFQIGMSESYDKYYLNGCVIDGIAYGDPFSIPVGVGDEPNLPSAPTMRAWPNPFNPQTQLELVLPAAGQSVLTLYDVTGREVKSLYNGFLPSGTHRFAVNGTGLASGIYFARLTTQTHSISLKLIVVK